ncbi:MAG: zinc-binding dehydrogenase [Armatimonadetes bacterium]|nr:zinc-binding dehydrogenase [Armatimonadota bacterium]
MLGVVFVGDGRAEVKEFADPKPKSGEALVQIAVSAICGSELHSYHSPQGSRGHVVGHEMVGEVVGVNQAGRLAVGDRVALQIMTGCGRCYYCLRGDYEHCKEMGYLIGGHAELIAAPEMCCLPLPDDVSWEQGVLLGGDTIGTTYRSLNRIGVTAFDTVAVLGCGPIGLGMLALLRFLSARVIAADVSPSRRELARKLGAWRVVDPSEDDLVGSVMDLTDGHGADIALDCSPSQATLTAALDCVRKFGTVGLVGEKGESTIHPSNQFLRKEITTVGSWYYSPSDYYEIMRLHRRGLEVDDLISHRFPLSQAEAAFSTFASGESGKVLIVR